MSNTQMFKSDFANSVFSISLDGIRMAFALAVALSWNTVVKKMISYFFKYKDESERIWAHVIYAIALTVVFALLLVIFKKFLKYENNSPVFYALTGMA